MVEQSSIKQVYSNKFKIMAIIQANDTNINDLLTANNKVVIKYYADWCGSCKLFAPKYKRLSDDERFNKLTFLDVNAEQNPEARKLAEVNNLPYFAVFSEGLLVEGSATSKEDNVVSMLEKINHESLS